MAACGGRAGGAASGSSSAPLLDHHPYAHSPTLPLLLEAAAAAAGTVPLAREGGASAARPQGGVVRTSSWEHVWGVALHSGMPQPIGLG